MFKLNQRHREIFSNKILDIADIAAGAMIFGQFFSGKPFNWLISSLAVVIICWAYAVSYILLKKEGDK